MQPRTGRPARTVAALICPAAVTGCASSASSSQPSAPGSTGEACPTSALRVKQGIAQGYAGGVYQVIDFTNTSGSTCTLFGYPGVSLVSGPPYVQIGLAAKRGTSTPRELVTLAPGATANAML